MTIDKKFIDQIIKVSSKAAYASSLLVGKKDKIAADKAAVDAMRTELNFLDINGKVVIGEGELDEAPMLYIGEMVGTKNGPDIDIAVDPVEGTNFAAKNLPGAISVIAMSNKNDLLNAPESYMEKISYPKGIDHNAIDLDFSLKKNLSNLADAKNKKFENLRICVLDRPRHKKIIDEAKSLNIDVKLISDGDVSGALLVTDEKHNVDLFLGTGGGPEGVLAAPQIGINKNIFVFDAGDGPKVAINPKLVKTEGSIVFMEGCLSLPGYYWDIERHEYAKIQCLNENGDETIYEGDELMGRVLQHELDHLKGKLLLKSMTRKQRKEALKEISIKGFPGDKI